jgi:ketosteroid isomerase-like protein
MSLSDTSPEASAAALAELETNRGAFLGAVACAPDAALRYRAPGEDYALGGLLEHVGAVMRHYTRVLSAVRAASFGPIAVPDAQQDLAAIAAGLSADERGGAVRRVIDAHAALIAELKECDPVDFTRTAPVVYGAAADAYPTSPADIVTWVSQHYAEHAEHIDKLLERWSDTTRDVVERFGDAFDRQDLDATLALMTEDCVFEDTQPAPDGTRCAGKASVREHFATFFSGSPSASFTTEELVVCGDRAVVRWRYDWGSGHVRGVDVMKVRDGLVAEKLAYVKG